MKTISEDGINALISLLADDDDEVYGAAQSRLIELGDASKPYLTEASNSKEPKLRSRARAILEDLRHGMEALRSPARVTAVVVWSIGLWLINGLSFYVMFHAFDIQVNLAGALLMQGVLAMGIAVPSAPGYVGVFEAAILLVLSTLYGVSDDVAVAYALTYHVTTFIPITLLGLWSVARTGLGLKGLRQAAARHHD